MKKSLLALAVFGAFAGVANAQTAPSNVTLYGILDTGVRYTKPTGNNPASGSTFDVYSGSQSGSRFGLRGSEDLGGGLRAIFNLEGGINVDTGTSAQGGRLFGRWAYAGLAGNWGEVRVGRQWAAGFEYFVDIDPFATGFFDAGLGRTFSSPGGLRLDNTVMYRLPTISGFTGMIGYSTKAAGSELAGTGNNDHVLTTGLRYANGPFLGVITYENIHNNNCYANGAYDPVTGALLAPAATGVNCPAGTSSGPTQSHLQLGATYDFKVVKLHGAYAYERNQFEFAAVTPSEKSQSYAGGLTVPLAGGSLFGQYQKRKDKSIAGANLRAISVGYTYPLSRRTNLEAFISDSKAQNDAIAAPAACPAVGTETGSSGQFQCLSRRMYAFGIRHQF